LVFFWLFRPEPLPRPSPGLGEPRNFRPKESQGVWTRFSSYGYGNDLSVKTPCAYLFFFLSDLLSITFYNQQMRHRPLRRFTCILVSHVSHTPAPSCAGCSVLFLTPFLCDVRPHLINVRTCFRSHHLQPLPSKSPLSLEFVKRC